MRPPHESQLLSACRTFRGNAIAATLGLAACLHLAGARAVEYELGDGKLRVSGAAFVGTAIRTARQDPTLLPDVNSSLLGIRGDSVAPGAGRNQDDGNLNFNRGDPVSTVFKGYLSLAYAWRDFGVEASGQAWYDYVTERSGHPWGNEPNGYSADRPLSDDGALLRSRFSGVVLDTLSVYGRHQGERGALDWQLGYQHVEWGQRFMVQGGLRDLNPLDIPASQRPGVVRDKEVRIGIPLALVRVGPSKETSVEAFYQFAFEPTVLGMCGTFLAPLDFLPEGCRKAMFGNLSDRTAVANGVYVKRTRTVQPSDSGQGGIAIRHKLPGGQTEFGLYAAQFHSRMVFYSGTNPGRAGPPFLPGDPDGLNPTYFTEYPERIRMYGATFESKLKLGLLYGELTVRPNQPLQYNPVDVIAGAVSRTAPTPLRDLINAVEPGGVFRAWERHEALQLQLGAATQVPNVLGSAGLSLGGELVYKRVPDLPDPADVRFGRSEVFGQGPVDGVCTPPADPVACSFDGYVSRNAFGYRLRASLRYADVAQGLDLMPSLVFGHDVSGWAGDYLLNEGRMFATVSLTANYAGHWTAALSWQPMWGGTYNNQRDRDTAQLHVGYQF
ncbi:MAG: DUF1302 domain-containing protein [Gammaproteobacteria bacterium]|nr:DUF1302 domain-containing protein [Gammaproteobacteria bacterium]